MIAIIGGGLAAYFTAYRLYRKGVPFLLFDDMKTSASSLAAGIVNPVVLKRFNVIQHAEVLLAELAVLLDDFHSISRYHLFEEYAVMRLFHDAAEEVTWQKKATAGAAQEYLDPKFYTIEIEKKSYTAGKVQQSGRFLVADFISYVRQLLDDMNCLRMEHFDYHAICRIRDQFQYKETLFTHLIFCEGIAVQNNPYFSYLPVVPNKGHRLAITGEITLPKKRIPKKKYFLFKEAASQYYFGGTYDRQALDRTVDSATVRELEEQFCSMTGWALEQKNYTADYAFRPTVADRQPIVGEHPKLKNMYVFNGLGARGVLNGCYYSKVLLEDVLENKALPSEVAVARFNHLLQEPE